MHFKIAIFFCKLIRFTSAHKGIKTFLFIFLQAIIEKIVWPDMDDDGDFDEECSLDDICRVAGYLRTFIENGNHNITGSCSGPECYSLSENL